MQRSTVIEVKQVMLASSLHSNDLPLLQEQRFLFGKLSSKSRMKRAHGRDRLSFDRFPETTHRFFYFW